MARTDGLTRNLCGLRIESTIRQLEELAREVQALPLDEENWEHVVTSIDKLQDAADAVDVELQTESS